MHRTSRCIERHRSNDDLALIRKCLHACLTVNYRVMWEKKKKEDNPRSCLFVVRNNCLISLFCFHHFSSLKERKCNEIIDKGRQDFRSTITSFEVKIEMKGHVRPFLLSFVIIIQQFFFLFFFSIYQNKFEGTYVHI